MSKRYPKAKWPLPAVVDPSQRLCVKVYVPNDDAHIAAFRGALLALQSAYNWQDDEAHTAKDVALVWREIIREMGTDWGCGIDTIEFRQSTNCGLEVSVDGGAWSSIYNGYNCALQAISDSVDNGAIAAPGQQAPGGTIPASSCETYNITLRANSRWRAPNPVEAGYTVQVTSARGDWSDTNGIIALWYCPDGLYSALGSCGGIPITDPSDPLPSLSHMRLIGYCHGVYTDMYNTTYIVPNGTPPSDFLLQCNDSNIGDNQGEISLTVTICNYATWCYTFDFTLAQGPFHGYQGGEAWVSGVGWQTVTSGANQIGGPQLDVQSTFHLTRMTIEYTNTGADAYNNEYIGRTGGGPPYTYVLLPDQSVGAHTYSWDLGAGTDTTQVHVSLDCASLATRNTTRRLTLYGTGVCPFGVPNC